MGELGTLRALRELCIKFEPLRWAKCRDLDYGAPALGENVGTLLLAKREDIGSKSCYVFARLMKRLRGRTRCVCFNIGNFFFFVHEKDHPSNISMNRTIEQLAENSAKKKEPFKELK